MPRLIIAIDVSLVHKTQELKLCMVHDDGWMISSHYSKSHGDTGNTFNSFMNIAWAQLTTDTRRLLLLNGVSDLV